MSMSAPTPKRHWRVTPSGGIGAILAQFVGQATDRDRPMLEIIVERWTNRDGSEEFLWSVWADGRRIDMGGPLKDAGAAARAGQRFCRMKLGSAADRITRL